jgi:hypothetical protein
MMFLAGLPNPERTLLASSKQHWSCYLDSDNSSLDGKDWTEKEILGDSTITGERKLRHYQHEDPPGNSINVPGFGPLISPKGNCDLERTIMGAMNPNDSYHAINNSFSMCSPNGSPRGVSRWTHGGFGSRRPDLF